MNLYHLTVVLLIAAASASSLSYDRSNEDIPSPYVNAKQPENEMDEADLRDMRQTLSHHQLEENEDLLKAIAAYQRMAHLVMEHPKLDDRCRKYSQHHGEHQFTRTELMQAMRSLIKIERKNESHEENMEKIKILQERLVWRIRKECHLTTEKKQRVELQGSV